jgi:hypothetical protein
VWVKLEKSNREESEPQEFSYLPTTSFSQHQHYGMCFTCSLLSYISEGVRVSVKLEKSQQGGE